MKIKFILLMIIFFWLSGCKKSDSDDSSSTTWDLNVKNPGGSTFVLAKGTFTFGSTTFTVHVITSRIGGGDIVKEFNMTGAMKGDSIIIENFAINLTDPIEVATINGRIWVGNSSMNGFGDYHVVQPPDTISMNGNFTVSGTKSK